MTEAPGLQIQKNQISRLKSILIRYGWSHVSPPNDLFELWRDGHHEREILLPLDPEKSDFKRLFTQALGVLTHDNNVAREPWLLSEAIFAAHMDTTSWKRHTNLEYGLINWSDGEELIAAAHASLIAAAKSSKEARRVHGRASHYIAKQFMDSCVMGQTGAGSFIVRAHTPSDQLFHLSEKSARSGPLDIGSLERVSGATVIEKLGTGVMAVRQGLDQFKVRPQLEVFDDLSTEGVSYELLKSLTDLSRDGESQIEIVREFSSGLIEPAVSVSFSATESSTLEKASRRLLGGTEPIDVSIVGEVTHLAHDSTDPHRVVRIKTEAGSPIRKVRVRLTSSQYDTAIDAHRSGRLLRLTGVLEREKNLHWLYGAQITGLIDPPAIVRFESSTLF